MAKRYPIVVILLVLVASSSYAFAHSLSGKITLDDFESHAVGKIPSSWRTWPFERGKAKRVYRVAEEEKNRYLRAVDGDDVSVQIMFMMDWRVNEMPTLSWRWRAQKLPSGANEADDTKNDSACAVYVIVGRFDGHALKYVWSSTLPVGKIATRREGRLKIKVLDSGPHLANRWQHHTINVLEDYQQLFGKPLEKKPVGIALLTDGNATHTKAACDYDDFTLSHAIP